ncbi:hypothetical protein ElyMa_004442000 [Elysia marginata]|uniref:Uncharacterized protein n=1 Tax=Elysia marginata TaxID=1093978 RepID=A0AAV4HCR6_9GAST|nr:hypothetical protein ElyMa_004442000 [Elysia marginata]
MPFMNRSSSLQSTVVGWQRRDVRHKSAFPSFKPRYATSNVFNHIYPKSHGYKETLSPAQVYTGTSRDAYMQLLQTALSGLPGDTTLQVRWRPSSEKPTFSLEFLQMYLSR